MPVMSVRLSEQELKRIKTLAKEEDKEKSSVARELLMDGLKYKMLLAYKEGKVSLAKLSKSLGMSLSEAIDLLSSFGLQSPISYDDYLKGVDTAQGYPLRAIGSCLWELKPTIAYCLIQDPTPCGCDDSGFIDRLYQ